MCFVWLTQPQAIIAATTQDVAMVGSGIYPFPLIEDGDFDIPSVYMTVEEGERLAAYVGQLVSLESRARRIPAAGVHVIARKGDYSGQRVVLFTHIDAKMGTPGAADNAAGVVILLLLAESLASTELFKVGVLGHSRAASEEMAHILQEYRQRIAPGGMPTPMLDRALEHITGARPPLPDGSSQMSMNWRSVWVSALAVLSFITFIFYRRRQ